MGTTAPKVSYAWVLAPFKSTYGLGGLGFKGLVASTSLNKWKVQCRRRWNTMWKLARYRALNPKPGAYNRDVEA